MTTTKSPRRVAEAALAAAKEVFGDYSHKFSPKKFTRPQLFACLALKEFERKDYRGVCVLLEDCSDLRAAIGLKSVPHYTTLHKACRRLLKLDNVRKLLDATVRPVERVKPGRGRTNRKVVRYGAADSSGFDARHASRYFVFRTTANDKKDKKDGKQGKDGGKSEGGKGKGECEGTGKAGKGAKKKVSYKRYGKLMVIVSCATHAILAAVASAGPTPDTDQLQGVLEELVPCVALRHMVGDAGFDSAGNHRLLREVHGILSTIPAEGGRPPKDPKALPADKYRRLMKTRFNKRAYRQRPQVETVFSMLKRNLGAALRGRSHWARCRDLLLRVLTHNIMLKR